MSMFKDKPNLCCTDDDVKIVADTSTSAGTLELVQCPQCDAKWVRQRD